MSDQFESRLQAAQSLPERKAAPKPALPNVAKSLATARQAVKPAVSIADAFEHEVACQFAFLGTGQGGAKLAQAHWDIGYRRVAAFNLTDSDFQDLSPEMPKLSLEVGGAAKDANLARQQLRGRDQEVWDLLTRAWGSEVEYGLICAGLGGGTGSGTAGPLAQLARKYLESLGKPPKVGALVSLPPASEGQAVARNAVRAFKELWELKVSPLIVIDNARIDALYNPPFLRLYSKANETVASLLHLFNYYARMKSPLQSFDANELRQLLDAGMLVMGAADLPVEAIHSPADISGQIREQLAETVLAVVDLQRSRGAACLYVGSEDVLSRLTREYFDAGFTQLNRIVGAAYQDVDPVVHRGVYVGEEGLQCYTLIAGLEPPHQTLNELAKMGGLAAGSGSELAKFLGVDG